MIFAGFVEGSDELFPAGNYLDFVPDQVDGLGEIGDLTEV